MNNNNVQNPHHLQPLRNNYHINPAQSKLVYHNPKQIQPTHINNNYNQQPINLNYQHPQSRPMQPYHNANVRSNSFDNVQSNYANQAGNVHYVHHSPPSNNMNRTVNYVSGPVYPVQSFPIQQNMVSQVYPVTHINKDVRFNYAVNQTNYPISSQQLHYQGNVVVNQSHQNTPQLNAQISIPPVLQPTIQSGVQTSTVVTAVTIPPQNQTSPIEAQHQRQSVHQQGVNPIWQQRFIMIYQKFEWFYQRYEFITRQFGVLSQDFQNVNSEDEWLQLKEKHDLLLQKIQQIQQELVNTIQENQELAQQYQIQNRNSKDTDQGQRVWQHRYHQLLQQYQSLSQNYADLQSQGNLGGSGHNQQLQQKYTQIQQQYHALYDEYSKMQEEFGKMHEQNAQLAKNNEEAISYTNKLQGYVQQLQAQNQHITEQLKRSSIQGGSAGGIPQQQFQQMQEQFNQQLGRYQEQMQQYHQEMQNRNHEIQQLSHIVMERQNRIKQLQSNVNRSGHSKTHEEDFQVQKNYISRLEHETKELKENYNSLIHKLQIKDMQKSSLEKKLLYVQQQYEQKKSQVQRVNRTFEEKLYRIQQNMMAPNQLTESKHSQSVPQNSNLQALLHTRNQTIKELQQRLSEFQLEIRKKTNQKNGMLFDFQGKLSAKQLELTKIIAQKDVKITFLNSQKQRLEETLKKKNKQKQLTEREHEDAKLAIQKKFKLKIEQIQQQLGEKSGESSQKLRIANDKILKLQTQISQKNAELGHVVKSSKQSTSKNDKVYEDLRVAQQALQRKNDQINKHKKQKQSKIRQIRQLQSQINDTTEQLNKKRVQISGLKRQLSDISSLQAQIQSLRTNLAKKNSEVMELRNLSFELQRSRMQLQASRRQNQRSNAELRERVKQIQNLRQSVHELQKKTRQLTSKSMTYAPQVSGHLRDDSETYQLKQSLRRKQLQMTRISSQVSDLKEKYQEASHQLQVQKSKILTQKKAYQHDQSSLNQKISTLQSRLRQNQSKKQQISEQLSHLRIQFQEQLTIEGQRHKGYYQKVISRHQQDHRLIKERVRQYQQQINNQQLEIQKNKKNQKRLQIQKMELQRKITQMTDSIKQKQELFQAYRDKQSQQQSSTKTIYQKLSITESKLKTKEQEMKLCEQKNLVLENKIKKMKKDHENVKNKLIVNAQYENSNSVVEYLSKRIADYQSHLMNQSQHDFGFKIKDVQANHVFENQVVYHLKRQNQLLRKELQGKGIHYDRMVLNQIQQENMKRSRNLLKASTLSSKLNITQNVEQISFYRQKNKQLEERVDKHIRVNKELKQKLESLIKNNTENSSVQYYKQHITELQETIHQLNIRIQSLNEQNRSYKKGMAKSQIRTENQNQERILQLQSKVKDLTKNNQILNAQNSELQINKSQWMMQKTLLADQIKRLTQQGKNMNSSRTQKYQEQVRTLRNKCENYQLQITKLNNKARILQSQIQRLKQTSNSSKLSTTEISNLKAKISQLNQFLMQRQSSLHEEEIKVNRLSEQVVKWQQKCRFLQNQVARLNELQQLYSKKQKTDLTDSTTLNRSLSSLQTEISNLQAQLTTLASRNIELQNKVAVMSQQIQFYNSLLNDLQYHHQFLRSSAIEQQALAQQLLLPRQNITQTIEALRLNSSKALNCLDTIHKKVKRVY